MLNRARHGHCQSIAPAPRQLPMTQMNSAPELLIRPFDLGDEPHVIELWKQCKLTRPWNNPQRDIARKLTLQPENFLVGLIQNQLVASVMAGYEGHRGWVNYLAVSPNHQQKHVGGQMMRAAEQRLLAMGCPKINLQIRGTNRDVIGFYHAIGYQIDDAISMGKRLVPDD